MTRYPLRRGLTIDDGPREPTSSFGHSGMIGSSPAGAELLARFEQRIRLLPPLAALYDALLQEAPAVPFWLVGGVLRDFLHDPTLPLREIDLVLEVDDPEATIALARGVAARTKAAVQTHDAFGTASLKLRLGPVGSSDSDVARIDIATARRESYARPAALPTINPAPIDLDLGRRDFTINSLALRLNAAPSPYNAHQRGSLLDPFGGRADLKGRRIRILHDASFRDDPTRLLRACRYAARISTDHRRARLTPDTSRAAREARPLLGKLTPARFGDAWRLLISDAAAVEALRRAEDLQLPRARLPGWTLPARLLTYYNPNVAPGWQLDAPDFFWALCGLLLPSSAPIAALPARADLRRAEREALLDGARLRAAKPIIGRRSTRVSRVSALLRPSPPVVLAAAYACWRGTAGHRVDAYLDTWLWLESPLNAQALLDLGVEKGPELRRWLNALRDAVLDERLEPDSDQAARWLQSRLRRSKAG